MRAKDSKWKKVQRAALTFLRIAKEVAPVLPNKGDSALQLIMKSLGAIEVLRKEINDGKDPLTEYISRHDYEKVYSEPFVSLFFDSVLGDEFKQRRIPLTPHEEGLLAKNARGSLFFVQNATDHEARPYFYHSPDFDIKAAIERVWEVNEGRISICVEMGMWGQTETHYGTFPGPQPNLFGEAGATLNALVETHRRFQIDGIPRSYCFYGRPGTGKTFIASHFAMKLGERVLKVDASSFVNARSQDFSYVLNILEPDFLIVNDIDKVSPNSVAQLLELLEQFRVYHPKTTLILTANSTSGFDRGVLRPERISDWIRFDPPTLSERLTLLRSFVKDSRFRPSDEVLETLAEATDGLTQDYLREIALSAERSDLSEVLKKIQHQKELLLGDQTPKAAAPKSEPKKKGKRSHGKKSANGASSGHPEQLTESPFPSSAESFQKPSMPFAKA